MNDGQSERCGDLLDRIAGSLDALASLAKLVIPRIEAEEAKRKKWEEEENK